MFGLNQRNFILLSLFAVIYFVFHTLYSMFGPVCQYLEQARDLTCMFNASLNFVLIILMIVWFIATIIVGLGEVKLILAESKNENVAKEGKVSKKKSSKKKVNRK